MRPLVLRPIRGVAEGFAAVEKVTEVGLLAGVRANVNLQVLLPREGLVAAHMLKI